MKNIIETILEMHNHDRENTTKLVGVSFQMSEGKSCKNFDKITMLAEKGSTTEIFTKKYTPILLLVDTDELKRRRNN